MEAKQSIANNTTIVGKIGLGTVQFGMAYGISNQSGQTPSTEAKIILDAASEKGIHYIDTASAYGAAEEVLGNNSLTGFKVVSKFMPPSEYGSIENQLQTSLRKLGINSLYGYLAHRPQNILDNKEQWRSLLRQKELGKIKKIGCSLNEPHELEDLLAIGFVPDLIQVPFNLFDNRFKNCMLELKGRGCEIHTRSVFLQGLFFMKSDRLPDFFNPVKQSISSLQDEYKNKLPGMLLNFALNKDFIDVVIIGIENLIQLKESLEQINYVADEGVKKYKVPNQILMPSMWPR